MKITKIAAALGFAALVGGLTGCGQSSDAGTSSSGGSSYENLTIKINTGVPPTHHLNQNVFLPWKDAVEEATDGQVKVELYDANTLGSLTTVLSDLDSGLYDVGVVVPTFFLDSPLYALTLANLVAAAPDQETGSKVISQYLDAEKSDISVPGVDIVGASTTTLYQVWSKKPITSVNDIKGLQVRVGSDIEAQAIELMGGTPVQVPPADSYQALERGTVDAAYFPAETALAFKLYEVAPNEYKTDIATTAIAMGVRSELLDSMSEPLQSLFNDQLIPQLVDLLGQTYGKVGAANETQIGELTSAGDLATTGISQSDRDLVASSSKSQWDAWAKEADGRGLDGQALVDKWFGLLDTEGAARPF